MRWRTFVMEAIGTLHRRGLTSKEISVLYGSGRGHIGEWARGRYEPLQVVADRFALLLRETAHLPEGQGAAWRRRKPHPAMADLVARIRPLIEAPAP